MTDVLAEDPHYDENADGDYVASDSDHSGAEDNGEGDSGTMGGRGKRRKKSGAGAPKR
jgi:hypothetical protein